MFVPLHDDAPLRVIRFQWMTLAIIVLNVAIFVLTGAFTSEAYQSSLGLDFGVVPYDMLRGHHLGPVPEPATLFTYEFIHGGWLHLIGNMLFMWVFADNVEDAFGRIGFIALFFICGAAGALLHCFMMQHSGLPLIGASASISGILAAYVTLFPRAKVWVLLFMRIPVPLPALWVLGGWFGLQLVGILWPPKGQDVAFWAHIGGFVIGLAVTFAARPWLSKRLGRI